MARLLLALFLLLNSRANELTLVGSKGRTNVWYVGPTNRFQLTHFPNRHHIYATEKNRTGKFALVCHMDFPPRRVSIYNLETKKEVSEFKPGVDGQFFWTAEDKILLLWGAGTGRFADVFDVTGKKVFDTGPGSPFHERFWYELHESGKAIIAIPMFVGQVALIRTLNFEIARAGPSNIRVGDWKQQGSTLIVNYGSQGASEWTNNFRANLPVTWVTNTVSSHLIDAAAALQR